MKARGACPSHLACVVAASADTSHTSCPAVVMRSWQLIKACWRCNLFEAGRAREQAGDRRVEGERASGRVDATQAAARDGEIREGDEVGATITVFEGAKSRFFVPKVVFLYSWGHESLLCGFRAGSPHAESAVRGATRISYFFYFVLSVFSVGLSSVQCGHFATFRDIYLSHGQAVREKNWHWVDICLIFS